MRSSSVESVTPIHRDEADQCSLNGDKEDGHLDEPQQSTKTGPSDGDGDDDDEPKVSVNVNAHGTRHHTNRSLQVPNSASLPCTLRKCKNGESCRGSNNCYVWSSEMQKKTDKYEKGCPKSKTICVHVVQGSDNEFLLPCSEDIETKEDDAKEPKSPSSESDGEDKPLAGSGSS